MHVHYLSLLLEYSLSAGCNLCRMSTEMVACIAVESISILEKLHSRGYGICNESVL
jgi:hypothetical protein